MCDKQFVNIQTKEVLDLNKIIELPDNNLLKVRPDLWVEWDFDKNNEIGLDIWSITRGSGKKSWWICEECQSSCFIETKSKTKGNNTCSYCSGKKVNNTNSLASLRPDLIPEWHPTKNGNLTPYDVTCGSSKKIWWVCQDCGYESLRRIKHRTNSKGCKRCNNRIPLSYYDICNKIKALNHKPNFKESEYQVGQKNFDIICEKGHETTISLTTLYRKGNCRLCTIESRMGENNHNWNGGVSEIGDYMRSQIKDWKFNSLKRTNFKCDITGIYSDDLEIHHLIPFSDLLNHSLRICGLPIKKLHEYSLEEKESLRLTLLKMHNEKLGVPLLGSIHRKFHSIFGRVNTTEDQYIFFKNNYDKFADGTYSINDYEIHKNKEVN